MQFRLAIFSLFIFLFTFSTNTYCQNSKLAIVSLEDTTIVRCHVGLTIFSNFTDTLRLNTPLASFIEKSLTKYLSPDYDVEVVRVPEEIRHNVNTFFGRSKEFKAWLKTIESKYRVIILVENMEIPSVMNIKVPANTSGFYTRLSRKYIYTTINFSAYMTNPIKELEYFHWGGELLTETKDFELPEDKRTFTKSGLDYIQESLLAHLDKRIVHFLHKSYLNPNAGTQNP